MKLLEKLGIKSKADFWNVVKQFIRFGIVGVSNTLISLLIYYIFIWINKDLYIVGNTVGFIISVLNAYYWNNKYVFKKTESGHTKTLIKTYVSYGITFLIGSGLLVVMVDLLGISKEIAPLINLVFTIPMNFLLGKLWVFKE